MKSCLRKIVIISGVAAVFLTGCNLPVQIVFPEPGPPPRPTVVVVTAEGPYATGFESEQGWLVGESAVSYGRVENGQYVLTISEPETLAWTNQQRVFGDGIYEVEATLVHGAEASGFGLLLLGSNDLQSFLYCMITGDGRYDIGYCEDGCEIQESLIGGYTIAPIILPDGQTNYLQVELSEGTLTFSVNGAAVSQVNDLEYSEGLLGLIGESASFGGLEATFDNLRVTE